MAHEVIMPQMGESIAEGTITTWLKSVGDEVALDEPLFEISTDKVDAEIPSPAAGTLLEIRAQPGDTVPVDSVVAVIGANGESAQTAAPAAAEPAPASAPAAPAASAPAQAPAPAAPASAAPSGAGPASAEDRRRTKSSPVVRKIASEHGIDIAQLQGTGLGGRVTKQDILAHVEAQRSGGAPAAAPAVVAAAPAGAPAMAQAPASVPGRIEIPEAYRAKVLDGDRVENLTPMRSKIAEHMVMSKAISAHVGTVFEVDFTRVAQLRAKYKAQWQEKYGVNLTYTSFIMKATVDALKAFPILNASLDDQQVIYHRDVNLGLAVALDWGLLVPVIHKADELNLLGLSRRAVDLATRARNKKLKPDEVQAGTFTITNPGIFGSLFGLPVINQPQVAILGVGTVEKRPVVIDDMIAVRTRAYMSLSFDHRVIDGAVADQFMVRIKEAIEGFEESDL